MKKRFTEEQIIGFLREGDAGMSVQEMCLLIFSDNTDNFQPRYGVVRPVASKKPAKAS